MEMAHHDNDDELLRSRAEGWRGFAHLLGWAITGVVIVLARSGGARATLAGYVSRVCGRRWLEDIASSS